MYFVGAARIASCALPRIPRHEVDSALRETWSLGRCAARLHPGVSFDRFTGVVEEEADRARARRAIVVAARRARVIAIVMRRRSPPANGGIKASAPTPRTFQRRSTAGSRKRWTRRYCKRPGRWSTSWRDDHVAAMREYMTTPSPPRRGLGGAEDGRVGVYRRSIKNSCVLASHSSLAKIRFSGHLALACRSLFFGF
jgi:hypothetical protein